LAKKRGTVSELHGKPRKMNPDAKKRIAIVLSAALVDKLKINAINTGVTLQRYVSDIVTKHLGE
jgi:predicted DNA binding CopG/RHH family protein